MLLAAQDAMAHVDVQPRLVEQSKIVDLRVELPRLRPGPAPQRLAVEGEGIEVMSTRLQGVKGSETVWSVRVRADAPPGRVPIILRAMYEDGESVAVHEALTVVPRPDTSSFPWPAVAGGTLLVLALSGGLLALARRRTG